MADSVFKQPRFQHRDMSGINITPLVDVLLVLLIIFMMQSIPKSQSLDLDLSRSNRQAIVPAPRTLLSVGMDRLIRMEGASIAPEDLRGELVALKARIPEATLALETNEGADYGSFARVLADARNAGFADVALRP
ncbi:MAG: biopolymer transporter ExbD [Thermomonas sp.]